MDKVKRRRVCVFTIHPAKDLRIFNRQCCSLQRNGWDVTLIGIFPDGDYEEDSVKIIGIKKWRSGWQRIRTILEIGCKAYRQKADIYHFHAPDLLVPAIFIRLFTRKPVIYDIHEFFHFQEWR